MLELLITDSSKAICHNLECQDRGRYDSCYTHVFILESCFRQYWEGLNDEQKEFILNPNQFDLTGMPKIEIGY